MIFLGNKIIFVGKFHYFINRPYSYQHYNENDPDAVSLDNDFM